MSRPWLRVGWVEDGKRQAGTIGTPQGSVISPLLANIFLNTVMDKWVSKWRSAEAKGDVINVRYVDDAVFGFQYESECRAFLEALVYNIPVCFLRCDMLLERRPELYRVGVLV